MYVLASRMEVVGGWVAIIIEGVLIKILHDDGDVMFGRISVCILLIEY